MPFVRRRSWKPELPLKQPDMFARQNIRGGLATRETKPRLMAPRGHIKGIWLPMLERVRQLREARSSPVALVFAGVHARAGVTYVVQDFAQQLGFYTGGAVLTGSSADIWAHEPRRGQSTEEESLHASFLEDGDLSATALLGAAQDYLLIDCPPLNVSTDGLLLARSTDGLCVVVEGGRTRRTELQSSLALLARSNIPVFGLILNKRRYPVPDFIYRML